MAELQQTDINRLERKIDSLRQVTDDVNDHISNIDASIDQMNNDLKDLADSFQKMIVEQKKATALQQASTELVRVRQELEQNYGNYKVIRETMLGVLQATDLALVKKQQYQEYQKNLCCQHPIIGWPPV